MTESIPNLSDLQTLRPQSTCVQSVISLPLSLAELWPHLSNTDLMNEALELEQPVYQWQAHESDGRPHLWALTKSVGLKQAYYEFPYEWQEHQFLQVERVYQQGLFQYFSYQLEAKPQGATCEVTVRFVCVPRVPAMVIKPILKGYTKKIEHVFQAICQNLQKAVQAVPASAYFQEVTQYQEPIQTLAKRLSYLLPGSPLAEQLASYIYCAPERYVYRLRPFEIARHFGAKMPHVVLLCLLASKDDILQTQWNLLCSSCWGAKHQVDDLQSVQAQYHCESCGIDYATSIEQNLELVFQPRDHIRKTRDQAFCAGSPANTPHIASQAILWPGSTLTFQLPQREGYYRLWCDQLAFELQIGAHGESQLELKAADWPQNTRLQLQSGAQILIEPDRDFFRLLRLQDLNYHEHRATAAHLYASQEFRELFSDQIPAPNTHFQAQDQLMLSLNLKIEPADPAIQQDFMDIFAQLSRDYQGAWVKTNHPEFETFIFNHSQDALSFARASLHYFQEALGLYPEHLLGLNQIVHTTACEITNQDQALCYRVQPLSDLDTYLQSAGAQLILASGLFERSEIQDWLATQDLQMLMPESFEPEPWIRFQTRYLLSLGV